MISKSRVSIVAILLTALALSVNPLLYYWANSTDDDEIRRLRVESIGQVSPYLTWIPLIVFLFVALIACWDIFARRNKVDNKSLDANK